MCGLAREGIAPRDPNYKRESDRNWWWKKTEDGGAALSQRWWCSRCNLRYAAATTGGLIDFATIWKILITMICTVSQNCRLPSASSISCRLVTLFLGFITSISYIFFPELSLRPVWNWRKKTSERKRKLLRRRRYRKCGGKFTVLWFFVCFFFLNFIPVSSQTTKK